MVKVMNASSTMRQMIQPACDEEMSGSGSNANSSLDLPEYNLPQDGPDILQQNVKHIMMDNFFGHTKD